VTLTGMSGVAGGVLNGSTRVDVAVVGGGIVGLATAYSVLTKSPTTSLILIEKEASLGLHQTGAQFWSSSLRNLLQTRIVEGCSLPQG
jgi:2-polyprenyl-6-methoxyphenol hydroxylase-like FAD-dependent oxidoreductase